jgi:4-hydroxybenzoate polyprenyltransferase
MYLSFRMHPVFLIFLAVIGLLLITEHYLVRPHDLTHIHIAFFHINSLISVLLFAGVLTQGFLK